jgi:metal-sulfur cluster biosynthetic enzyme
MDNLKPLILLALRSVIDPELMMDIVSLGLIYRIDVTDEQIRLELTLTTRGCPLGESIRAMAEEALAGIAAGRRVDVETVWNPPWNPAMIDDSSALLAGH